MDAKYVKPKETTIQDDIYVILYARVSTDEQADNCSLDFQERTLRMYCSNHGYHIVAVYREDYSARGYDLKRPEMLKIYEYCKKHRREVNKILFLRWDRYARNVEFAFAYKRKFYDELGIEINSIEASINFKSPDWSTMLSIYCGVAHTEDDKISKRTKDGIHEHLMNGEWCGIAPRGYKNVRKSRSECHIEVDEQNAELIRKVFREVAKGIEKPNTIRKRLCPHIGHTAFFKLLRNRFYIGMVRVPAYEDEPEHEVRGRHIPIVDESTFYSVQEQLDGKKKTIPKLSKPINPVLYLRKFLYCPVCGYKLTGAVSRGHGGQYPYYCCNHDHSHLNMRAERVNESFLEYIGKLHPNKAILALYNEVLMDIRGDVVRSNHKQADALNAEEEKLKQRIQRVNDLFFDGELSKAEKNENLARYKKELDKLHDKQDVLRMSSDLNIREKLDYSMNIIGNLTEFFRSGDTEVKIKLLGSIFPEKIYFDGKNYRTSRFNHMFSAIFHETKHLQNNKKMESPDFSEDSTSVAPRGIEPLFKV